MPWNGTLFKCENNKDCPMSGINMMYGEEATPESIETPTCEDRYEAVDQAYKPGETVAIVWNKY
jgi:hypothetical protein